MAQHRNRVSNSYEQQKISARGQKISDLAEVLARQKAAIKELLKKQKPKVEELNHQRREKEEEIKNRDLPTQREQGTVYQKICDEIVERGNAILTSESKNKKI